MILSIKKEIKGLQKEVIKKSKTKKRPSGFAIPSKVSKELCHFMGKEEESEIARTDVTKYISKYIKDKRLQNPENKRVILPDDKLKKLLSITIDDELTYFNIQKYMNKHFILISNQ